MLLKFIKLPVIENLFAHSSKRTKTVTIFLACWKVSSTCSKNSLYATSTGEPTVPNKVVFISQSSDIFSNLAFEGWLYNQWDFSRRHLLFLWRNSPCVVIGRHQNPFQEVNLSYLESAKIPFARRQSGGGTVYHDSGNLNCSFFTPRER